MKLVKSLTSLLRSLLLKTFLIFLFCSWTTFTFALPPTTFMRTTGPMIGSFAVYCQRPPGLHLRKRAEATIVKIAGPPMEGSFVFYGCCPGNGLGIANKVDENVVSSSIEIKNQVQTANVLTSKLIKVSQGPMRGSFVMMGCPPGFKP